MSSQIPSGSHSLPTSQSTEYYRWLHDWDGFRWVIALALSMILGMGCTRESKITREGFEALPAKTGLPKDWDIKCDGGAYETGLTQDSKEGKTSLCFVGAGGKAKLYGKAKEVLPGQAFSFNAWIRPKLFTETSTAVIGICDELDDSVLTSSKLPTSVEAGEWKQHELLFPAKAGDGPRKVRPMIEIVGEGLLSIDDVQECVLELEADLQFADGSFENLADGNPSAEWEVSSDKSTGKALGSSTFPSRGKSCLALKNGGKWTVASWKVTVPAKSAKVYFRGYARAHVGKAHLKIEHYSNGKRLEDVRSQEVSDKPWQFLAIASNDRLEDVDRIKVSLCAEQSFDNDLLWTEFDDLQIIVVKNK
jgi:hypothetical protein